MTRCSCVEDVVCGACMSGAVDPFTGAPTAPADDVRDETAKAMCAVEERAKASTLGGYVAGVQMWRRFTYEAERLIAELADRGLEVRPRGAVTDAERYATALREIANGDGPGFVREFAREALTSSSNDACPEWNCPDLSPEDRREGRTCPDHPCTCPDAPRGTGTDAEVEAAAQAMFEDGLAMEGDYTWAEMVAEDPSRADIWRADARRVLAAAEAARLS